MVCSGFCDCSSSLGCCLCLIREVYKEKFSQRQREQDFQAIKIQRKAAWQCIRETEFHDRLIGETICRTDINTITEELAERFGQPEYEAVPNVEQGLVLISQREFYSDA